MQENKKLEVPVITWATSTGFKRITSRVCCPLLHRLWSSKERIRIALHPFDCHYPATIKSIERVIKSALEQREAELYRQLSASSGSLIL